MSDFKRPEIISYQGDEYYKAVDLKTYDSCYFYGTSTGIRRIIQKKNIDKSAYHYATFAKRKGWSSDDQEKPCKKAILLLRRNWVEKNIPRMMTGEDGEHQKGYEYPEAPDLLILEDEEKFRDHKGVTVDIETRGERTPKGIYFLAKDVGEAFGMNTLINTILSNDSYVKGTHYDTFVHQRIISNNSLPNKQLFITYKGMLKVLFNHRVGKADTFVDWATETLFTHQMGNTEQKEELGSTLLGCDVRHIRTALKPYSSKLSSVYCFSLGTGKSLRNSMGLSVDTVSDEDIIIKFGFTDDLDRRSTEHVKEYEKIKGVKMRLMEYVYIDPAFLSEAETELKHFFTAIETPVLYRKYRELVSINPTHLKQIQMKYKAIGVGYQGNCSHMIAKLDKLEWQLKMKDKDIELKNKDIELKDKEMVMKEEDNRRQLEMKDREMELKEEDNRRQLEIRDIQLKMKEEQLKMKDEHVELQNKFIGQLERKNSR